MDFFNATTDFYLDKLNDCIRNKDQFIPTSHLKKETLVKNSESEVSFNSIPIKKDQESLIIQDKLNSINEEFFDNSSDKNKNDCCNNNHSSLWNIFDNENENYYDCICFYSTEYDKNYCPVCGSEDCFCSDISLGYYY